MVYKCTVKGRGKTMECEIHEMYIEYFRRVEESWFNI